MVDNIDSDTSSGKKRKKTGGEGGPETGLPAEQVSRQPAAGSEPIPPQSGETAGGTPPAEMQTASMTPKTEAEEIAEAKTMAAVGYFGVLFVIPMATLKDNKFAQFHAKQSMILNLTFVVTYIVLFVLTMITMYFIVGFLCIPLLFVIVIIHIILEIMGCVKALNGEYWKMPVVSGWAEKIRF
jgi:uncharacterized membrane protein